MKVHMYFLMFVTLLLVGCATPMQQHTEIQWQIQEKQQRLERDGKVFLAKAEDILSSMHSEDPRFKQVLDILEKSQALLGVTAADAQKLKEKSGKELTAVIDDIYEDDVKVQTKIDELQAKEQKVLAEAVTKTIQDQAVERYKTVQRIKFAAICTMLLAGLGTLCYFAPFLGTISALKPLFGIFSFLSFWKKN